MITFKEGNYIDEKKLDRKEAAWFISFLAEERQRHVLAQRLCDFNRYAYRNIPVMKTAYETSVTRHLDDIKHIDKTIKYLRNKFKINPLEA